MANKQNVTVYEASGNKYVRAATEFLPNASNVKVMDTGKANFLRENPFLFNSDSNPYNITSIEEYLVIHRKEENTFGDFIRNTNVSAGKRKKIVKQVFKHWDKDYIQKKEKAFKDNEKTVDVIGGINFLRFSFRLKMLVYLMFIFILFIITPTSSIWNQISSINIGYSLNLSVVNVLNENSWLKVVGNITIYILLVMIFYSTIFNTISKDYTKDYRLAQDFLNSSEKKISHEYKKKYNRAYKYYLKIVSSRKRIIPPYDIKNIEEGKINITTFNSISQSTIDKAYNLKKRKPYYIAVKNLLMFLSIGGTLSVIGFIIYSLTAGILNL